GGDPGSGLRGRVLGPRAHDDGPPGRVDVPPPLHPDRAAPERARAGRLRRSPPRDGYAEPARPVVPSYLSLTALYLVLPRGAAGWPRGAAVLAIGVFFCALTNVTNAAVFDLVGARMQASAYGLTSVLTQVIILPAPVVAGWLVERLGYGSPVVLSAAFMLAGA